MSQKSIILIVVLFVLLVAGMFTFAYLKNSELTAESNITPAQPAEKVEDLYSDITRIDAKHYFIDGIHTLVGEIIMPTPCDLVETEAVVAESFPEQVTLFFSVINNAETCAEVLTAYRFQAEFKASEQATITARFMERDVILNLIPAAAGETPDEFELFIKG